MSSRRAEIEQYVSTFADILGLRQWQIRVKIARANSPDGQTRADVVPFPRYMTADLTIYPILWSDFPNDPASRERTILHELAHCVTRPMFDLADECKAEAAKLEEADESVTEHLTAIVWELLQKVRVVVSEDEQESPS